jgi:hypothetical protein
MKPGYKTTEFWISAICILVSLVWGSGVIGEGTPADRTLATIAGTTSVLGYTISRGIAKKS